MERTTRITKADFFSGIFAVVALSGHKGLFFNKAFDEDVARIFQELMEHAKQRGIDMGFRIRLHPFHGDSETIHKGVFAAVQRGIISVDTPENSIIRIKLSQDEARVILNNITGGKLFIDFADRIIMILSHY